VELQYAAMPSFIAATYCKKDGELFVVENQGLKQTDLNLRILNEIEKAKDDEGIITMQKGAA
jgi:hypothetical protein